jgi:putative hemolysin
MIWTIIFIIVLVLLSAFFSGIETAYLSTNKLGIEVLKNKGSEKGQILTEIYEDPRSFLTTTLLGNIIALVVFTLLLGPIVYRFLDEQLLLSSWLIGLIVIVVLTLIILVFAEFLPKTFFRLYANEWIYRLANPLKIFNWILAIPRWIVMKVSNGILSFFVAVKSDDQGQSSKLDLEHYITHNASEEKDIDKEILNNALNLNTLKVKECMVPRNEIVFVDKNDDIKTIRDAFIQSKLSRLIVVDGDIENIKGYLHHQQMFKNITKINSHVIDIDYIPDVMNVQDLMHKFIKDSTNIACIVDEFGGTAGIITLEDILEEIFGEIADEHDVEEFIETVVTPDEFIFSGRLEISYLNDKYDLEIPDDDYVTLSGYIVMTYGSIPEIGQKVTLENLTFEVIYKTDTKVDLLRLTKSIHPESTTN